MWSLDAAGEPPTADVSQLCNPCTLLLLLLLLLVPARKCCEVSQL
jgi:hypothetical protein